MFLWNMLRVIELRDREAKEAIGPYAAGEGRTALVILFLIGSLMADKNASIFRRRKEYIREVVRSIEGEHPL